MDDIAERRAARRRLAAEEDARALRRQAESEARLATKPRGLCTPPSETRTFSDYVVSKSLALFASGFGRLCLRRGEAPKLEAPSSVRALEDKKEETYKEETYTEPPSPREQRQPPQRSRRAYPPLPHSRARTPPPQRRAYYREEEVLPVARFPERAVVNSRPWARTGEAPSASQTDLASRGDGF